MHPVVGPNFRARPEPADEGQVEEHPRTFRDACDDTAGGGVSTERTEGRRHGAKSSRLHQRLGPSLGAQGVTTSQNRVGGFMMEVSR